LSDEEKEQWMPWSGVMMEARAASHRSGELWLFNKDTVDKALEHLMTRGQKVAGGDGSEKPSSSQEFRRTQFYRRAVQCELSASQRHIRVNDYIQDQNAQSLIDDFSQKNKAPHLAISVTCSTRH